MKKKETTCNMLRRTCFIEVRSCRRSARRTRKTTRADPKRRGRKKKKERKKGGTLKRQPQKPSNPKNPAAFSPQKKQNQNIHTKNLTRENSPKQCQSSVQKTLRTRHPKKSRTLKQEAKKERALWCRTFGPKGRLFFQGKIS